MGIIDWVRKRLHKDEQGQPDAAAADRPESQLRPSRRRTVRDQMNDLRGQYSSRHGEARAQRYWHRHLSPDARRRKRVRHEIVRGSRKANR